MIDVKGKNAFVTGSSRGVGQQIVLGLASLGCNVIVHGRTSKSCEPTMALLEAYDVKKFSVHGELSDEQQIAGLISQVKQTGLDIDILYNNAAIMKEYHADIWSHSWEEWIETYKVNVLAMYSLCGAFIPAMIERGFGRVINLTSRIMNNPELAPYGASKWAVDKLTHDISSKLDGTGVRINYMDPGWLKTDMGGSNAENPVEAVLPGAFAPLLVDDNGPNGQFFSAIDYKSKSIKDLY